MAKKKAFVLTIPYSGHVNPICGLIQELQQSGVDCIVYSSTIFQGVIENTGAQFRSYAEKNFVELPWPKVTQRDKSDFMVQIYTLMFESSYKIIPQLLLDYEQDKPDVTIFDANFTVARFLYWLLKKDQTNIKMVEFYPNYVWTQEMLDRADTLIPNKLKMAMFKAKLLWIYMKISWTFSLGLKNPIKMPMGEDELIKIVAVYPEIHPDISRYDDSFKFVGQCVAEEARSFDLSVDLELKSLLDTFPIKGEDSSHDPASSKLILMSLGTLFNANEFIFEFLINDIDNFNKIPGHHLKASQLRVILAVGKESLEALNTKVASGELRIPSNIILRAYVPQLEILKRADLFITHCGMNSTSEAIKYGVPIVGIPIASDQPFVAEQVCDRLEMGIRLNPLSLKADDIGDAIDKVLCEPKYGEKMRAMSRKSASYNGRKEGARLILDLINQGDV